MSNNPRAFLCINGERLVEISSEPFALKKSASGVYESVLECNDTIYRFHLSYQWQFIQPLLFTDGTIYGLLAQESLDQDGQIVKPFATEQTQSLAKA